MEIEDISRAVSSCAATSQLTTQHLKAACPLESTKSLWVSPRVNAHGAYVQYTQVAAEVLQLLIPELFVCAGPWTGFLGKCKDAEVLSHRGCSPSVLPVSLYWSPLTPLTTSELFQNSMVYEQIMSKIFADEYSSL